MAGQGGKVVDYLEQLQTQQPQLSEDIAELASLYQRKLWHQLTLKLEACFAKTEFNKGDLPLQLYNNFIADFGHKINLLKLAQFAVHVSKHIRDHAAAVAFLTSVVDKLAEYKLPRSEEPTLFLRMHLAQHRLEMGQMAECKELVGDCWQRCSARPVVSFWLQHDGMADNVSTHAHSVCG